MKKYLPFLMLIALAFVGCNSGPAVYEDSTPENFIKNSEKFVRQTEKNCSKYTSWDEWQKSLEYYTHMLKDFSNLKTELNDNDIQEFRKIRIRYCDATAKTEFEDKEAVIEKAKDLYNRIFPNE